MSYKYTFSVFTATYNRAYCLHRPYEGLKSQTFKDFEWIIIDDGSTDDTRQLVEKWQAEAPFPIRYVVQPHAGKHFAFNTAAPLLEGELFTQVDSDDTVKPNWLERFKFHWDSFTPEQRTYVSGVFCLAETQHGKQIGESFPDDGIITDFVKYTLQKKVTGDKGFFWQSKVFQMYPFPTEVKNVYVPEGWFWHQMCREWKSKLINEILIVPYVEDRPDHTTLLLRKPQNYAGNRYGQLSFLRFSPKLFWVRPYTYLANAVYYSKLSFLCKYSLKKQFNDIVNPWGKMFWLFTFPLGYILAKRTEKENLQA